MTLSRDDVAHVAMLARLGLSDDELERYRHQLDAILDAIGRLNEVDTSSVEETAQVGGLVNVWREDEPRESIGSERALANAPDRDDGYFRVGAIQE
ncbi:MAG TPA: Asp-tRNA(Asn)/Glu-tRNA(Gln) amidotransferase subunit GatC [Candidatus Dormibacteraeota bacterium]|nr:Asp-tRNA(Asn)/Glu-tRNA(Gln) amidotransferase subunit GatC [Candidatus Dormibacteraeota bacterium]